MTNEEVRAFIAQYVSLWEHDDARGLAACYTEDAHVESPMFHGLEGRDAIEKSFVELFQAMSDSKIGVTDLIVDRDRAVTVFTSHGTHTGVLFGMRGTGRRVEIHGAFLMTFENGLIATELRLYDFVGMLVQLGVLKTKAL